MIRDVSPGAWSNNSLRRTFRSRASSSRCRCDREGGVGQTVRCGRFYSIDDCRQSRRWNWCLDRCRLSFDRCSSFLLLYWRRSSSVIIILVQKNVVPLLWRSSCLEWKWWENVCASSRSTKLIPILQFCERRPMTHETIKERCFSSTDRSIECIEDVEAFL